MDQRDKEKPKDTSNQQIQTTTQRRFSDESLLRFAVEFSRYPEADDADATLPSELKESESTPTDVKHKSENVFPEVAPSISERKESINTETSLLSESSVTDENSSRHYVVQLLDDNDNGSDELPLSREMEMVQFPDRVLPENSPVHENEQIAIAIPDDSNDDEPISQNQNNQLYLVPEGYLETHLYIMNYLGASSYRRVEYRQLALLPSIFLSIFYWTITCIAFTQTVWILKSELIVTAIEKDLATCVRLGYAILRMLKKYYFIYLISFAQAKLSIMLMQSRKVVEFVRTSQSRNGKLSRLTFGLTICTLLFTFLVTLAGYPDFKSWTFQKSIQYRAYSMGENVLLWNHKNYNNTTASLRNVYMTEILTASQIVMGTLEWVFDFCEKLQGQIIRDFLILASLTLYRIWIHFEQRVEPQTLIHPNTADAVEVETCLRLYKIFRVATKAINSAVSTITKVVIIQNLLLYGYCFIQIISGQNMRANIVQSTGDAVKASIMYYVSLKISRTNETIIEWLRMLTTYDGPVNIHAILGMTIQAAIDDLRDFPIGFGSDYFLIDETFLVGFFAATGSLISFLADAE